MRPKLRHRRRQAFICAAASVCAIASSRAQTIGSLAGERARLREITGDSALVRADSVRRLDLPRSLLGTRLVPILPSLRVAWNSTIPYSLNDGSLWAGRGMNASLMTGFETERNIGPSVLRLTVAPRLFFSENQPFQVIPNRTSGRSGWANPFHGPGVSLDLPHRFGDRSLTGFDFGNSAVAVELPRVSLGITSADSWWGPGIRNALMMSNNGPGIPRLYLRATPAHTKLGTVEAELITGSLTKSRFFSGTEPDFRSLSGLRVELRPAFDSALTLGFARVVYAPIEQGDSQTLATMSRSFDALLRWDNEIATTQGSDQIAAIFARWIFPVVGFEVYGEWARMDLPRSWTELLVAPQASGAWTFGLQWAHEMRLHSYLRLQSEISYLEQSTVYSDRPTVDFYSSRASQHGYTQRGQVIGASIGPGSSSHFLALDWVSRSWQAGVFLGRVRWDNDALYREQGATFLHHDVSLLSGVRGGWRTRFTDVTAELTVAGRYNYLFQNALVAPPGGATVDVSNITLVLAATPR